MVPGLPRAGASQSLARGMAKKAFITGLAGQDGSYLAELLLARGYEVHGTVRPGTDLATSRVAHLVGETSPGVGRLSVHRLDLNAPQGLRELLDAVQPDEVYHLAAPSHVGQSFEQPEAACAAIGLGALRLLEAVRRQPRPPRLFLASSSEIFGRPARAPQDEETPLAPVTPYGCAMALVTHLARAWRLVHGLFVCCGILYNHESPRRGEQFVTRKITRAAAAIKLGLQDILELGNLEAQRDWGDARDYVRAMWLALQAASPGDYVVASGQTHAVRDVLDLAFGHLGLDWRRHVRTDPRLLRPAEPQTLVGDATRARTLLGWAPTRTFADLIREMTEADLAALRGVGAAAVPVR